MKNSYFNFFPLAFLVLSLFSCSSDESSNDNNGMKLSVEDFTITIDELPINVNDFLGTLVSNMEGEFSILNENPVGALSVNPISGDITITDVDQFNYEINPVITATIQITKGNETATGTVRVNLNNIDEIEFYLTDSKQDYSDADPGDWILITESEFNALATSLDDVTKVATSDDYYTQNETINGANHPATWVHDNGVTIPSGDFVFAVKYYSFDDNATGTKMKQSSPSITGDYLDLGNILPTHNSGEHFFVLKGNTIPVSAEGFLAIHSPVSIGFKLFSESMYAGEPGDVNTIFNVNLTGSIIMYQGLSTSIKQWD